MTEAEFLKQHGNLNMLFESCHKHTFQYISADGKYSVRGLAHYRGDFNPVMTVSELKKEMETFDFEVNEIEIDNAPTAPAPECVHPVRYQEHYRIGCFKCWKCGKIIIQN